MGDNSQLDLDFCAPADDGYAIWQWDRKKAIRRVADEWALPLGAEVRLRRRGIDGEFEGKLDLVMLPPRIDKHLPLTLKIGKMIFCSSEIEMCSRV